ncbi:hypothetical protein AYO44_09265 [Planctomycetaceae bacterium SCGC AG-212-F19]|nr:hypothetical protein AYO44_09265 [Planctomycetaceae bacterium SCGC AG-212-F19]
MTPTHALVGTWRGCAFPTQETAVVLCPDGRGFLFFYWGSLGAPFLDEFAWSADQDGKLAVRWHVRHDFPDNGSVDMTVTAGTSEMLPYEVISGSNRSLRLELGLHAGFDTPLEYVGAAGDSATERGRWQQFTKHFNPFGPGRGVWTVDDRNRWRPL